MALVTSSLTEAEGDGKIGVEIKASALTSS
jgi:hypothetical protein